MCKTLQNLHRLQWGNMIIDVVVVIVRLMITVIMLVEMVVVPYCTHRNALPPVIYTTTSCLAIFSHAR